MRYIQICEHGEWVTYELHRVSKPKQSRGPQPTPAVSDAATWLREYLTSGSKQSADVYSAAEIHGHSAYAVRQAVKRIGCTAYKAGLDGGWVMQLPALHTAPHAAAVFGSGEGLEDLLA